MLHARPVVASTNSSNAVSKKVLRVLAGSAFDCIVFNDVLEHLIDPWETLVEARELLAPGGSVVASIPNVRYAPVLWDLVARGQWPYRGDGVLDQTHLRFFTLRSIETMFRSTGYRVRRIEGIHVLRSMKIHLLRALTFNALADLAYRQIAVVAFPAEPSLASSR